MARPAGILALAAVMVLLLAHTVPAQTAVKVETIFEDVTEAVGLPGSVVPLVGGSAWVDYDNDGWVDLDMGGAIWRNEKGKSFKKIEGPEFGSLQAWGDFDNDGWTDRLSRGGSQFTVHRNLKGKKFAPFTTDLPAQAPRGSHSSLSGDFNGDGYLDVYVGGYAFPKWQNYDYDVLYFNDKKMGFTEVWRTEGRFLPTRGLSTGDFDEDGDLDLYVSHYRLERNILWQNDGKGKLTDVAAEFGAWSGRAHTISSVFGDMDDDGHLDIFVANFSHPGQGQSQFLKNLGPEGNFHFKNMSSKAGLARQESYASVVLGDYDNDGDLDLFLTTVYPGDHRTLHRNDGNWVFTDVTETTGIPLVQTYDAIFVDYDNDGDLDLQFGGRLYRNRGNSNHWLKVSVRGDGKKVSVSAIGTQARIRIGDRVLTRQVESLVGENNHPDLSMHFGLGSHSGNVVVEILWPDGTKQTGKTRVDRHVLVKKSR